MAAGNVIGEKFPVFVIGNSKTPLCFKHIKKLQIRKEELDGKSNIWRMGAQTWPNILNGRKKNCNTYW